jgi:hypothetical protein
MSEVVAASTERALEEIELEIENFEDEYEGEDDYEKWEKVKEKVEMMGRTSEEEEKEDGDYLVTTARVELVISDPAVREIGHHAFEGCVNIWKIRAPFVEEVGEYAFLNCRNLVEVVLPNVNTVNNRAFQLRTCLRKVALPNARSIVEYAFGYCYDLRHITLHPDVEVDRWAFSYCLSLEVLAASTNFEIDTGDKTPGGNNDPTRGITRYLKWRNESDAARKEQMYAYMVMTKLCFVDEKDPNAPPARAKPNDPISKFLVEKCMGDTGIGRHLLSFFGETRGKGDLRAATKAELLAVGLELKALRKENNSFNRLHWGVMVDDNGEAVVDGGNN